MNPNFDLDEVMKKPNPEIDKLYRTPADKTYQPMDSQDLIFIYANIFNAPKHSRNVYQRMMDKYDHFFEAEKRKVELRLNYFMTGKQMNEIVKLVIVHFD